MQCTYIFAIEGIFLNLIKRNSCAAETNCIFDFFLIQSAECCGCVLNVVVGISWIGLNWMDIQNNLIDIHRDCHIQLRGTLCQLQCNAFRRYSLIEFYAVLNCSKQ